MKCVFIANSHSGKGRILKYKNYIISKLCEKYDEVIWKETEYAGHATELAKEYGNKCDYLLFSGGDGTLNEVVNGIFQNDVRPIIGQIPSGTTNDFSKSIGIKKNIKKSLKQLISASEQVIDIFRNNNKHGVYICGFGLFTRTSYVSSEKSKKYFGRLAYFFSGIKEIITYKPGSVQIVIDEEIIDKNDDPNEGIGTEIL